jgi:hypothetical protein
LKESIDSELQRLEDHWASMKMGMYFILKQNPFYLHCVSL